MFLWRGRYHNLRNRNIQFEAIIYCWHVIFVILACLFECTELLIDCIETMPFSSNE